MTDSMDLQRAAAGLSFLFRPGERPDELGLRAVLAASSADVQVVGESAGTLELVSRGLTFDVDGLVPRPACPAPMARDGHGFAQQPDVAALEAVRLYPGHHLSGGLATAPVVHAMLALAAEIATGLPVQVVVWHPAEIAIEPGRFAHGALAWLAGGAFPAASLAALAPLADGSVVTRGLAHFVGQEIAVRGRAGEGADQTLRVAAGVADRMVRQGRVESVCEYTVDGEVLQLEPSTRGHQVWVWRSA